MKKILIYGSGGHGKVVLEILLTAGFPIAGFIDDNENQHNKIVNTYSVLGSLAMKKDMTDRYSVVLGIGNNQIRKKTYEQAKTLGFEIVSAVHRSAIIASTVKLGEGVVVMPGAVINTDSVIGTGAVVNTGATVDHDCILSAFCQIWPGANLAGSISVGELSYVGTGSAVIQNIKIGNNVMIGAGSAVITDIPDHSTAVGVPAKIIKKT